MRVFGGAILMIVRVVGLGLLMSFGSACNGPEGAPKISVIVDTLVVHRDLYDIRDVAVADDGTVAVLRKTPPHLLVSLPNGSQVEFGKRGRGPGELRNPWNVMLRGDGVYVWDVGGRQIQRFTRMGEFLGDVSVSAAVGTVRQDVEETSFWRPLQMRSLSSGFALQVHPLGVMNPVDLKDLVVLQIGEAGNVVDTLVRLDARAAPPAGVRLFFDTPMWAICPKDDIVAFDPSGPGLRWYKWGQQRTPAGEMDPLASLERRLVNDREIRTNLADWLHRDLQGAVMTDDDVQRRIDQVLASARQLYSPEAPFFSGIVCTEGIVWLRGFDATQRPNGQGNDWIRRGVGEPERMIMFDGRIDVLAPGRSGGLLGILTDSLGFETLVSITVGTRSG